MSPSEIAVATSGSRNAIDQLLYKMAKAGDVLKAGRGRYVHPTRADLILARTSTPHKNDKKIRNGADAQGDEAKNGDAFLTGNPEPVRNEGSAIRNEGGAEPSAKSAELDASYLLTDLTGGKSPAAEWSVPVLKRQTAE
ncbi:hypothetical protein [Methylobacterium sp. Leaf361]|uniref:hypothetical protein n=1 Tax=Methylobacterium sp. Leaf361 TaxID=1736352 RepID=UPI000AAD7940|nr:hypothetical protein [Methylobacterium sp. Leaf361]